MSFTAVLDTDLGGAPLVQAVQEAFGDAMVFQDTADTGETMIHRWRAADGDDSLEVVEDASMNVVYAVTTEAPVRAEIVAAFGCFSAADIREVVASDLAEEHVRLPMLALCDSQAFDPETERLLVAASQHARAEVRLSAVLVMVTLGWPALRARLFAMQSEGDPRIVRVLQRAAAVWTARARVERGGASKRVPARGGFRE